MAAYLAAGIIAAHHRASLRAQYEKRINGTGAWLFDSDDMQSMQQTTNAFAIFVMRVGWPASSPLYAVQTRRC